MLEQTIVQSLIDNPRKMNGLDCISVNFARDMGNETLKAQLAYVLLLEDDKAGLKDATIEVLVKELAKRL